MSTLYLESVELASEVRTLLPRLTQKDQDLARRMKRSADELTLHLEESMLTTGRARRYELRAAGAAILELSGCLRAAESVGYLEARPLRLEAHLSSLRTRLAGAVEARAPACEQNQASNQNARSDLKRAQAS